jgi:hypothetical protein
VREEQSAEEVMPAWGTPPIGPDVLKQRRLRARVLQVGSSVAAVLLAVGFLTIGVAAEGQIPLVDAVAGLVLLAAGVAIVAVVVVGCRWLVRRSRVWWGRAASLLLTAGSVWALVLAVRYDNTHRYPNGMATEVGQLAMGATFAGVVAGLAGTWTTFASRAARGLLGDAMQEPALWQAPVPEEEPRRVVPAPERPGPIALSWDGRYLVLCAPRKRKDVVQVWDVDSGTVLWERDLGAVAGGALAVSPDGSMVAAGCRGLHVLLLDLADGTDRGRISHVSGDWEGVAFGPRSRGLAVSNDQGRIRIYDLATRTRPAGPRRLRDDLMAAVFSPHNLARRVGKLSEDLTSLLFSPDGTLVAAGGINGKIKVWDIATGAVRFHVRHGTHIHSLGFASDSARLVSAGDDGTCRIWDLGTGQQVVVVRHGSTRTLAALDPSGRLLCTAGDDDNLLIWNLTTSRPLVRMRQQEPIQYLATSGNGRGLASAGEHRLLLWNWPRTDE